MKFLKALFSSKSEVSSMRVMCMVSLALGGGIAVYGIVKDRDLSALAVLCSVFVGAAFGGKVGQKFAEKPASQEEPPKEE